MLKRLTLIGAGAALVMLPLGIAGAGALPFGGIGGTVHPAASAPQPDVVIRIGSGKTKGLTDRRKRGASDAASRARYFTRKKIITDHYSGHIPPEGVNGPVIYTYRWFDNGYGGRR